MGTRMRTLFFSEGAPSFLLLLGLQPEFGVETNDNDSAMPTENLLRKWQISDVWLVICCCCPQNISVATSWQCSVVEERERQRLTLSSERAGGKKGRSRTFGKYKSVYVNAIDVYNSTMRITFVCNETKYIFASSSQKESRKLSFSERMRE